MRTLLHPQRIADADIAEADAGAARAVEAVAEPRHRLLIVAADSVLAEILVPLMSGPATRDFQVEVQNHPPTALQWLASRRFDAYLFEESALSLLAGLPEAERRAIERRSVVLTLLESAHPAALTCAACVPLARMTPRALENALCQAVRRNSVRREAVRAAESRSYETFLRLARTKPRERPALGLALQPLTEAASQELGVGRVSVWVLREDPKRLVCLDLFDRESGAHQSGIEVPASACPRYCLALREHRILAIEDALRDERCAELVDIYLQQAGIGALLDAPLYLDGEVVGLLCHAHLGRPRRWTGAESALAASFADHVQLALLADKRQRAEQTLAAREQELAKARKMEALGRLAGGVAHDFNNLLTVITGNAQLLRSGAAGAEAKLATVLAACERSRDLVRQLLSFAAPTVGARAWVDVHKVIDEVRGMLAASLRPDITVRTELRAPEAVVYGEATSIQSALLNLAINARDAMRDGGTLTFASERVIEPDGGRAMLQVSVIDTGAGMSEEVRERVLEPFFTTKPAGEGSGLGLANVSSCATAHGGALDFETEVGRGTTFRLLLPLHHGPVGAEPARAASGGSAPARILVVDDDEAVRQTVGELLAFLGHRPTLCADGFAALQALGADRDGFDLALIDVVMPVMGGRDCWRAMRLLAPRLSCILMTGTVPRASLVDKLPPGALDVVAKPFDLGELSRAVESALGSAAARR
jgi:signal transduction histidine kinase/ActR/RegA family two-component response regulator